MVRLAERVGSRAGWSLALIRAVRCCNFYKTTLLHSGVRYQQCTAGRQALATTAAPFVVGGVLPLACTLQRLSERPVFGFSPAVVVGRWPYRTTRCCVNNTVCKVGCEESVSGKPQLASLSGLALPHASTREKQQECLGFGVHVFPKPLNVCSWKGGAVAKAWQSIFLFGSLFFVQ